MLYAEKTIKSGRMLERYFYPVLPSGRALPSCPKKTTTKAQAAYNKKQTVNEIVRLVNCNFDTGDIFLSPTFTPSKAPKSYDEAKRILNNYIRRVRNYRRKHNQPELKYLYVIEEIEYKSPRLKGVKNYHYHIFLSRMSRDDAEELWDGLGVERVNALRFQPDKFGQEAAGRYLGKADIINRKRFVCSRNCHRPQISVSDKFNLSKRKIENMCKKYAYDSTYWERRANGYKFDSADVVYNEYNGRYYLRVVMRELCEANSKANLKKKNRYRI